MDLLAQYSGSDDAGAGGDTDDDVATTAAMLRAKHAVPDLAPGTHATPHRARSRY